MELAKNAIYIACQVMIRKCAGVKIVKPIRFLQTKEHVNIVLNIKKLIYKLENNALLLNAKLTKLFFQLETVKHVRKVLNHLKTNIRVSVPLLLHALLPLSQVLDANILKQLKKRVV